MRVFKTRGFARFARQEMISDEALARAIRQAEAGLVDADLGSGLIKLRLARPGSGKRGGYRTLIAYQAKSRAVFLFGFAKNERENIVSRPACRTESYREWLYPPKRQRHSPSDVREGRLQEVDYDEENEG